MDLIVLMGYQENGEDLKRELLMQMARLQILKTAE
jgi:hypothetical protein